MTFFNWIDSCHEYLTVKKVKQQPSSSINKEDLVLLESSSSPTGGKTAMRRTHSKRPCHEPAASSFNHATHFSHSLS